MERDFLDVAATEAGSQSPSTRQNALQAGDYLNMDARTFAAWVDLELNGPQSLVPAVSGTVRVEIKELLDPDDTGSARKLRVESGGNTKVVDPSLFYNYYRPELGSDQVSN